MKASLLVPTPNNRFQFHLRFRKFVPRVPGCYALAAFDDQVLYVGLTENLHRRFTQHWDSNVKRAPTIFGAAFWFYFVCCGEKDLLRIERTWMNEYKQLHGELPVLNNMNSPVR